jgi:DNA helicase-2/ATP-dependent DNA helicase PcrA
MEKTQPLSAAEDAAKKALQAVFAAIEQRKNFILEAGAGAGKTYSLVRALRHLIKNNGASLLRNGQKIACITFTNVASHEITTRTDSHPAVHSSTIHAFCWLLIKDFQSELRKLIPTLGTWPARLEKAEVTDIGRRAVIYDLGYPKVKPDEIWLGHNDVLQLFVGLMGFAKFRALLQTRFPIIFIDEYQDTDANIVESIKEFFLETNTGPLIGFFGDHWQKIYGTGCGRIEHKNLIVIDKRANFRSAKSIVDSLNKMRPTLTQEISDPDIKGEVSVYHTNAVVKSRQRGAHWGGDLEPEDAHACLETVRQELQQKGWDLSASKTKILMLTHKVLASEQGYRRIADLFPNNDSYIRKEDPYIEYLIDVIEPVCEAYQKRKFGEMFSVLESRTPTVKTHSDKVAWAKSMDALINFRNDGTIGQVIDHLRQSNKPRLPEKIELSETTLKKLEGEPEESYDEDSKLVFDLKKIRYSEILALTKYVNEHSLFSTKHGVKGAEFENVIVVVGRGWSKYNFNQMLEWIQTGVPNGKADSFEDNRNLFYVACSRPRRRLSLIFTQQLGADAITTLNNWFGAENIKALN